MHTPQPSPALERAIAFIEGFEDDTGQAGVRELLADLRELAVAPDPLGPIQGPVRAKYHGTHLTITSADRCSHNRYWRWLDAQNWDNWHPAHWHEHLRRRTPDGREWGHSGGIYVLDDFGSLVLVEPAP
ncbi:MAG: hypothetical protein KIS62_01365 [Ramlibacter sp.]|nr:hypothetical protein [Ramlibacter sp.]